MGRRRYRRVLPEVRRQVKRLAGEGLTHRQIMARLELPKGTVQAILQPLGGVIRKDMLAVCDSRLGMAERVEIALGIERGWAYRRIGAEIGRSPSTVCREVANNGGRGCYQPVKAHQRATELARRPKPFKLAEHPQLLERVKTDLEALWSPQQIAARLRQDAERGASLGTVSHETIYKSIYVQGRGELRRELARCLRTGRAKRQPHSRLEQPRQRAGDLVLISQRPPEAEDRAVPGHWEGDLIVGKDHKSYIATLVERSTRYVMLAKVDDAKAETVSAAIAKLVPRLPAQLWRSLTWDQGSEMVGGHQNLTAATDLAVYFCDPHSPWQRGSNENTNGLLRQYFPKGTPLDGYSQEDLDRAAVSLNGRPRETLGWQTPAEKLTDLLLQ